MTMAMAKMTPTPDDGNSPAGAVGGPTDRRRVLAAAGRRRRYHFRRN